MFDGDPMSTPASVSLGIAACVEAVMDAHEQGGAGGVQRVESLRQLEGLDAWARMEARRNLA